MGNTWMQMEPLAIIAWGWKTVRGQALMIFAYALMATIGTDHHICAHNVVEEKESDIMGLIQLGNVNVFKMLIGTKNQVVVFASMDMFSFQIQNVYYVICKMLEQ